MALKITDNFNYTGRQPNFKRDQFATTSEMNACSVCDEGHISYNLQDGKHYEFKNGAWSVFKTGGSDPSATPMDLSNYPTTSQMNSEISSALTSYYTKTELNGILANSIVTSYNNLTDTPNLSTVATTGSYNDLLNKPTIPTVSITQINKNDGTQLVPSSGVVTLPIIPTDASDISFNDSITQLGTQENPVTNVQAAINQLATGIQGLTGKLKIRLLYQNSTPVTSKEVGISVYYRGSSYDISSQYSPSTEGFKTDLDGYVINNNSNEYLVLPLGATYTITLYDISDNYITPENKSGIIDANTITVNCIYNNVSDVEFVKVYVQTPNTPITIANVENKKVYVDFYSSSTVHALQYVCLLRANGTIKQILEADGTTQATYNGGPLISNSEPVLIPVPNGTKYTCALQEWDESISSENQRYVKSANQTYTASKAKRSLTFTYTDKQLGLFLLVKDSTQAKGYRTCLITEINSTTNFKISDVFQNESVSYIITRSSSNVYRQVEGDSNQELWEEEILGVGVRTSQSVFESNDDLDTQNEYPDCSFFVPMNVTTVSGISMLNEDTTAVSLPSNYGGLYITKCLYNLSPSPTSPVAHKLIDETTFDITLQTPNNNKTIKGFIPSSPQALIIRGCLSNFNNIWNIVKGSNFSISGTQNNIWTCTPTGSSAQFNNGFIVYTRGSIATPNPSVTSGTAVSVLFAIYPF